MTIIAALAISYLEHLNSTGAGIAFGFFSVVSISEASCSLSTLVAAVPLGLFILFDAPLQFEPSKRAAFFILRRYD